MTTNGRVVPDFFFTGFFLVSFSFQHFPLYRASDETCQGEDAATGAEKVEPFEPKWDCLSQQASDWVYLFIPSFLDSFIHSFIHSFWAPLQLLKQLRPSAVFSGHTHNGCEYRHGSALEYSVPSLSWRNRDNPGYLLVSEPLIGRSGQFVANQEPPPPLSPGSNTSYTRKRALVVFHRRKESKLDTQKNKR